MADISRLSEIYNETQDANQILYIRGLIDKFPLLEKLPIESINTMQYKKNIEGDLNAAENRSYGGSFNSSTQKFGEGAETLKMLGGKFDCDLQEDHRRLIDGMTWVEKQKEAKYKSIQYGHKENFMNGKLGKDPSGVNGIKELLKIQNKQIKDTTRPLIIPIDSSATSVSAKTAEEWQILLDKLIAATEGLPSMGFAIPSIMNVIQAKFDNSLLKGVLNLTSENVNGVDVMVYVYRSIFKIYDFGSDHLGVPIMKFDEKFGASALTSSIIAAKTGADHLKMVVKDGILPMELPMQLDEFQKKWNVQATQLFTSDRNRSIAAIQGILAPA